jgi:hypothetical protein
MYNSIFTVTFKLKVQMPSKKNVPLLTATQVKLTLLQIPNTVNIQNPDRPVFKWSFSGHFLSPVIKWSGFQVHGSTRLVRVSNGLLA